MSASELTDTDVRPESATASAAGTGLLVPFRDRLAALNLRIAGIITGAIIIMAALVTGTLAAVPRVDISPTDGEAAIRSDSLIRLEVPRFSSISKVSVSVNGEQKWLEYNIEDSVYSPPVQLSSGSLVTVDIKTTSALGVVREFTSSFTTIEPLAVTSARADGLEIGPASSIAPQTPMSFSFDKPVTAAWISIDGAASLPLTIETDGLSGSLGPGFVLKQGAEHSLTVIASGRDGSGIAPGEKKTFQVIQPLALTADTAAFSATEPSQVFIRSSVPFDDLELVRKSVQVSHPDICDFSVEPSGILLNIHDLGDKEIIVSVSSAYGNDGSYLELPAEFHFRGTVGTSGGSGPAAVSVSAIHGSTIPGPVNPVTGASGSAESDVPPPPPGWPPCCPWPPR